MPGFEVYAARTFSLAALVYGRHARIERFQPRHNAVRMPVCAAYQRASRSNPRVGDSDAARKLREHGDIGVLAVNTIEAVLRAIEQEARRELFMLRARVEERWRRRNVFQRRKEMIEADRLMRTLG